MTPALIALAALGCYLAVVRLILAAVANTDDPPALDHDDDDLMAVADAVQQWDNPCYRRDFIERLDMALYELEMPAELQDPALRGEEA